jgi:hypothetical protein
MEFLKLWKKGVIAALGVLAVIAAILAFDARYAKPEDVQKVEVITDAKIKTVETNTAKSINEVTKTIQLQQNVIRLNAVNDQLIKTRGLIKTYPKDKELQEDYENLKEERTKIQQSIDKGLK